MSGSPMSPRLGSEYVAVGQQHDVGPSLSPHSLGQSAAGNRSLKNRLFSMWNNAVNTQYFKPKFSPNSPVWLLGELYGARSTSDFESSKPGPDSSEHSDHISEALDDIGSRLLMTYREGFPMIPGSRYTSDVGWGCMLRSAQMLLAQALLMCTVGRDFRLKHGGNSKYNEIIRLFHDTESTESPFSVHNLLRVSSRYGVKPGTWLGPSIACTALSRAVNIISPHSAYGELVAYVALDCLVSKSEIMRVVQATGKSFRPLLILIPLRLGVDKLNQVYVPSLQNIFSYHECVGMIGGKPGHSMYFIGFQGAELIGLDPHICQLVTDLSPDAVARETYKCKSPRKIKFSSVDPSLAIAFVCRSQDELEHFYRFSEQDADGRMTPLYTIQA